jgi:hypothetical protein
VDFLALEIVGVARRLGWEGVDPPAPPGEGKIRRKACLVSAKGRGVQLGNPNVGKINTEAAAARDAILRPILHEMWAMPYRDIAQELTNRNIPTPRGGDLWSAMTVMRVMKRLRIAGR